MSDFRGIGGASLTLQRLLRDRIQAPTGVPLNNIQVTVSSPKSELEAGVEGPRVNLFLYRVTENGSLKNQQIPGQGHPAEYGHPPLSLNLHYLLTAYGTTTQNNEIPNERRAQDLLGSAMRVLHDFPIVTDQLLSVRAPAGLPILDDSLFDDFESVKITLEPTSLEETSKIWTALTLPYRLSATYLVTVVQIESRLRRRLAQPVRTRRLHVATMQRPQISSVYRNLAPSDIRAGVLQQLVVEGEGFFSANTLVKLGELQPFPVVVTRDDQLAVTVPDAVAPPQEPLQPGAHVVQVITERAGEMVSGGLNDKGDLLPTTRREISNPSVFLLAPQLTGSNPPSGTPGTVLNLAGTRLWRSGLKTTVMVGEASIDVRMPQPGDVFAAPTPTSIEVVISGLPPDPTPYPVRVAVNGVTSIDERTFQVT